MNQLTIFASGDATYIQDNPKAVFLNKVLMPNEKNEVQPMQKYHPIMMLNTQNLVIHETFTEIDKKTILKALADLKENEHFLCVAGKVEDEDAKKYYFRMVEIMNTTPNITPNEAQTKAREEFMGTEFVSATN